MAGKETYQYLKIRDYIIKNIKDGKYENNKIESENVLKQKFNVSRMTVRQALETLKQEGILYTVPKLGVFVQDKEKFKSLDGLQSFSEDVAGLEGITSTKVIKCEKTQGSDTALTNNGHQNVWHIIRIRYVNTVPIAYEDGFFNADIIDTIPKHALDTSLYKFFEDELGVQIDFANQEISAVLDPNIAKLLALSEKSPLLKVQQTTYTIDNQCLEECATYYRCDMYSFHQKAYRRKT